MLNDFSCIRSRFILYAEGEVTVRECTLVLSRSVQKRRRQSSCRRPNTIYCRVLKAGDHTGLSDRFLVEELENVTTKGTVF